MLYIVMLERTDDRCVVSESLQGIHATESDAIKQIRTSLNNDSAIGQECKGRFNFYISHKPDEIGKKLKKIISFEEYIEYEEDGDDSYIWLLYEYIF